MGILQKYNKKQKMWYEISEKNKYDPRPDLEDDHLRWVVVLKLAWKFQDKLDKQLYCNLHGIRCIGGELVPSYGHFRLTLPGDTKNPGHIKKEYLVPNKDKIEWLFTQGYKVWEKEGEK